MATEALAILNQDADIPLTMQKHQAVYKQLNLWTRRRSYVRKKKLRPCMSCRPASDGTEAHSNSQSLFCSFSSRTRRRNFLINHESFRALISPCPSRYTTPDALAWCMKDNSLSRLCSASDTEDSDDASKGWVVCKIRRSVHFHDRFV